MQRFGFSDQVRIVDILVETANDVEKQNALDILEPWDGKIWITVIPRGGITVFFGLVGEVKIGVVRTGQGSQGQIGSATVTSVLIGILKPKIVSCVGVCFGTNGQIRNASPNNSLALGDVLIASRIFPYDHEAVRDSGSALRGTIYQLPLFLTHLVTEHSKEWSAHNALTDPRLQSRPKAYVGDLLSGSKLLDNSELHSKLVDLAHRKGAEPLGGEMEGYGAIGSQTWESEIPVLVIKGICDWGMVKTDGYQDLAARGAFDFFKSIARPLSVGVFPILQQGTERAIDRLLQPMDLTVPSAEHASMASAAATLIKCLKDENNIKNSDEYREIEEKIEGMKKEMKKMKGELDKLVSTLGHRKSTAIESLEGAWMQDVVSDSLRIHDDIIQRRVDAGSCWTKTAVSRVVLPVDLAMIKSLHQQSSGKVEYVLKNKRPSARMEDDGDINEDD